jgi:hypothetical protein
MRLSTILILLSCISACGKSNSNAGIPKIDDIPLPVNGSNIKGLYMAKFNTLNAQAVGTLPGSATLQRLDDNFTAYIRLFGGAPASWHQQNVYEGGRCPEATNDTNGDGYIDMEEGDRVWGKILIPLDSNINSQDAGKNIFPIADASGTYFYERSASFEQLFNDLKEFDQDPSDNTTKLSPDSGLDFEGRVVVIQGSSPTLVYPETIARPEGREIHQSLPVACGVLSSVESIPGEMEAGDIPGPVGEPEPEVTPVPVPEPTPAPTPTPEIPTNIPAPEDNEDADDHDDSWYERLSDWWNERWDSARGNHRNRWGDGWRL